MALIHHMVAKQAQKLNIELFVDVDTVVARDTLFNVDQEFSGMNAKELLARVLAARPQDEPKAPKAKRPAKVVDEDEGDEDADEADEDAETGEAEDAFEGEADEDAEDEDEKVSGSVVKGKYKEAYEPFDATCGDEYAEVFSAKCRDADGNLDHAALIAVGAENGVDVLGRWGNLNNGMQRMNLSNVLRGMVRGGTRISIGGVVFNPTPKDEVAE